MLFMNSYSLFRYAIKIKKMKATFESDDPQEIKRLTKSLDMASALFEIKHNLKNYTQYDIDSFDFENITKAIEKIMSDNGVNPDELIS